MAGAVGGGQEAGRLIGLDSACRRSMVRDRVVGAIRPGEESGRRLLAGKADGAGFYGRNRAEEIAAVFEGRERRSEDWLPGSRRTGGTKRKIALGYMKKSARGVCGKRQTVAKSPSAASRQLILKVMLFCLYL